MNEKPTRKQIVAEAHQNVVNLFYNYQKSIEAILAVPPETPINEEYCWTHEDENGAPYGWTCPLCRVHNPQ